MTEDMEGFNKMNNFYRMSEEEEEAMMRQMWEDDMWHQIEQEEMAEITAKNEERMKEKKTR
jgi:hypothetical protein